MTPSASIDSLLAQCLDLQASRRAWVMASVALQEALTQAESRVQFLERALTEQMAENDMQRSCIDALQDTVGELQRAVKGNR